MQWRSAPKARDCTGPSLMEDRFSAYHAFPFIVFLQFLCLPIGQFPSQQYRQILLYALSGLKVIITLGARNFTLSYISKIVVMHLTKTIGHQSASRSEVYQRVCNLQDVSSVEVLLPLSCSGPIG